MSTYSHDANGSEHLFMLSSNVYICMFKDLFAVKPHAVIPQHPFKTSCCGRTTCGHIPQHAQPFKSNVYIQLHCVYIAVLTASGSDRCWKYLEGLIGAIYIYISDKLRPIPCSIFPSATSLSRSNSQLAVNQLMILNSCCTCTMKNRLMKICVVEKHAVHTAMISLQYN